MSDTSIFRLEIQDHATYGNAVLSRYPIVEAESLRVAASSVKRAAEFAADDVWLPKPETLITLWGTHLSVDRVERALTK